jgi:hypothetical protein
MDVFLVRSKNSALGVIPVHAVFTDPDEADQAAVLFAATEATHLQEAWADNWPLFTSTFYVEPLTADMPAQQIADAMYSKDA